MTSSVITIQPIVQGKTEVIIIQAEIFKNTFVKNNKSKDHQFLKIPDLAHPSF